MLFMVEGSLVDCLTKYQVSSSPIPKDTGARQLGFNGERVRPLPVFDPGNLFNELSSVSRHKGCDWVQFVSRRDHVNAIMVRHASSTGETILISGITKKGNLRQGQLCLQYQDGQVKVLTLDLNRGLKPGMKNWNYSDDNRIGIFSTMAEVATNISDPTYVNTFDIKEDSQLESGKIAGKIF